MMPDNVTQLGIAGLTLAILFFIVRYFVEALKEKDKRNGDLADKLLDLSQRNIEANKKLSDSIDANTQATKTNTDNLSKLMLELIKSQ